MRISDWSSDVCSSDLDSGFGIRDSGFGIRDSSKRERHITCVIPNPQSPIPNPGPQGITGGTYVSVNPSTHSNPRTSGICTSSCRKVKPTMRSEEHTSELQSLMRISYAVFCLKKKKSKQHQERNKNDKHHTNN